MAMTKQLWSINALSVELGTDRRTLAKRLADLPPDEEKKIGARIEKRWHLADVLGHLGVLGSARQKDDEEMEGFKKIIGEVLFPAIITSGYFTGFFVRSMAADLKLSKSDALRAYQIFVVAFAFAICEALKDNDMLLELPACIHEMAELTTENYAAKYWPEAETH